jgi:SAM-dependent methyltransferase
VVGIKGAVKAVVPSSVVVARRRWLLKRTEARFRDSSNAEIFSTVYEKRHWGRTDDGGFSSGDGSHAPAIYEPYVAAVRDFFATLPAEPDVVDLGCGDFNVGRLIRPYCANYVAGDVVAAMIERNRQLPDAADVDFRCLDIAKDPLPEGEVVMIRQVLQHLSNADIARVLPKLRAYRYAIVTDHQPAGAFTANADIPSGPHVRVGIGSALDLLQPPFELESLEARDLCLAMDGDDTVIRTTLFRLR